MGKAKASGGKGNKSASASESGGSSAKLKACNYVKCRHILCEKQSKILEALEKIRAGERFDAVATQYSEDKARQGGDLGWKGRQDVVGAFAEAAFALNTGEMTPAPIKTQFGYHLILVEGRKASL